MSDEQHPSGEIIPFDYFADGGSGGPAEGGQKLRHRHRQHRAVGHGPGLRCVPGDGADLAGAAARAHAGGVGPQFEARNLKHEARFEARNLKHEAGFEARNLKHEAGFEARNLKHEARNKFKAQRRK